MNWYEKLSEYFPIEEMKSKAHMEALLKEQSDVYHKEEGQYHVLMYAEFDSFIFIDYLFVSKKSRGQGLGSKLIGRLKRKTSRFCLRWSLLTRMTRIHRNACVFIKESISSTRSQSGIGAGHWLRMK